MFYFTCDRAFMEVSLQHISDVKSDTSCFWTLNCRCTARIRWSSEIGIIFIFRIRLFIITKIDKSKSKNEKNE